MNRIPSARYAQAIAAGFEAIPAAIRPRVEHAQFFCGVDPVWAGLHNFKAMTYGRSYRSVAHTCFPWHLTRPASDRATTIVLPCPESPRVIVHELGHVLDEALGFEHTAGAVTRYAQTDRGEAFAEAFSAWVLPDYLPRGRDGLFRDQPTVDLFERLAA